MLLKRVKHEDSPSIENFRALYIENISLKNNRKRISLRSMGLKFFPAKKAIKLNAG